MALNVFWCLSPNFGDALSPWLAARISGTDVAYVPSESRIRKHLIGGSMLNHADDAMIVWGSGLASMGDGCDARADVRAVRGPLSQMVARKWKMDVPSVYGDPALLLPRLLPPAAEQPYRFGIVPHYLDLQFVVSSWDYRHPEVLVIDPLQPVETVVRQITTCQRILSSSLHGLIVAGAYGVPAARVTFGAILGGDGMKFADYSLSVGLPVSDAVRLDTRESLTVETFAAIKTMVPRAFDPDPLWEACPFRPL